MESHAGLKGLLRMPWFYRILQSLVGSDARALRYAHRNIWKLQPGIKVIDIGCGPRPLIDWIDFNVNYIGIDINSGYVRSAMERHKNRGIFLVGTTNDYINDSRLSAADLIVCNGVLHHLTDQEVMDLMEFVKRNLIPKTGRFTAIEPCHLDYEPRLSKWVMDRDRGKHVRLEMDWKKLLSRCSGISYETRILSGLIRIPYFHLIIDCYIQDQDP